MLVVTLISGCGKTFLSRLFRSDHGEFTEILTDFLDAAIRMIRRKYKNYLQKMYQEKNLKSNRTNFLNFTARQ